MSTGAVSAAATPSKTSQCANCHSGAAVPITLTAESNDGVTALYSVSAPGAEAIAVFDGTAKVASITGASGIFSAAVGRTHSVQAVNGPSTSSGIGVQSVTPAAPTVDTAAPVTTSDVQVSYVSAATINFSATDAGGSGVAGTYYILDGGPQIAGASLVVSAPGNHTVEYWSVDNAGNAEPCKSATFSVGIALPTSLTAVVSATTVSYGGVAMFTGNLVSTSGLADKPVVLQRSADNRTWTNTTVTGVTDALGAYSLAVKSTSRTYYRVVFVGTSDLVPAASGVLAVKPRVSLTRPTAPKSIARNRAFTSYGYLKPRHKAGTYPVKIKAYRYQGGKWVLRKTVSAKASNYSSYTKYTKRFSLPYAGKWRVRAYHATDSLNASTNSTYGYLTVK